MFLRIISNKLINLVITVVIASIPFYIFIFCEITFGTGNYELRVDEAFMCLALTTGVVTALVEIGKLFPKTISGIFNFVAFCWAAFHGFYLMFGEHDPFYFFQAMCAWGPLLYPLIYFFLRKFVNQGYLVPLAPVATFALCLLFGLIPAFIGNAFVAFKLPFILSCAGILAILFLVFKAGWDVISTAYYNTIGSLLEHLPTSKGKGDSGKVDPIPYVSDEERIINAISGIGDGYYFDIVDVSVYQNGGRWCVDVKVNRKPGFEGLYSNSVYASQKDAFQYAIEDKVASLGLPAGRAHVYIVG